MYRPREVGFGNVLLHLSKLKDNECVSSDLYNWKYFGKYFRLKNIQVKDDDGTLPDINPGIIIGDPDHKRIMEILEPTEDFMKLYEKYRPLISGMDFGLQIRRCGFSSVKSVNRDTGANFKFCTDKTLQEFMRLVHATTGRVFLTTDCYETKKLFKKTFGDKISMIDEEPEHVAHCGDKDPWLTYLEWYLLSKCQLIVMTGGDKDMFTFSTYGYTSALYGNKRFIPYFNS